MSDNEDESSMSEHELLRTLRALSQQTTDLPQALRGLLGQLGTDLPIFDLNPQYRDLLERIKPGSPVNVQTASLADLVEMLSMTTEEMLTIAGFDLQAFVPVLATLIQSPATIDVLLHASRALAALLDMYTSPTVLDLTLQSDVVASLCEKLLNIEYMDVAEIALRMLERIASSTADGVRSLVLDENALIALLQFVDFFSTDVQRGAARTAALLCTAVPMASWTQVEAALPLLQNLTKSYDAQIVGSGCEALQRLCESPCVRATPSILDHVVDTPLEAYLLEQLVTYTQARRPDNMALATYATLLHLFGVLCHLRESPFLVSNADVRSVLFAVLSSHGSSQVVDEALFFLGAILPTEHASSAYVDAVAGLVETVVPSLFASYDATHDAKYLGKLHVLVTFLSHSVLKHDRLLCHFVAASVQRNDPTEMALAEALIGLAMTHAPSVYAPAFVRDGVVEALAANPAYATLVATSFASAPTTSAVLEALRHIVQLQHTDEVWQSLQTLLATETPTPYELRSSGLVPSLLTRLRDAPSSAAAFTQWPILASVLRDAIGVEVQSLEAGDATLMGLGSTLSMVELLGQHLKMRLRAESSTKPLDAVVLVEPLARIETLEEFVADKVFGKADLVRAEDDTTNDEPDDAGFDPRPPSRMQVLLSGMPVPSEWTVIEALVRSAPQETLPVDVSALWQAPQVLTFVPRAATETETSVGVDDAIAETDTATPFWAYLDLLAVLCKEAPTVDVVQPAVAAYIDSCLLQPMLVVLELLPRSCRRIVQNYAFLLPRETKLHYLYGTRFGPARALQYLGRTLWKHAVRRPSGTPDNALATAVSRVAKLPRLKVRVARAKLLASASKLLHAYGGMKAIIEIEYLGEVGTGLGPTTEFFSLVSREVQAQHLRLWRHDGPMTERKASIDEKVLAANAHAMPVRGYHRIAVLHCPSCAVVTFPHCTNCKCLCTGNDGVCASCDAPPSLACQTASCEAKEMTLSFWILSNDEVAYLARAYPRQKASVRHPMLKCSHCHTVSFPGTDSGIVVLDGDRMVSRSGRRMYERDYRAVTKHVSALCEGTPLKQINVQLDKSAVDVLIALSPTTPEVLDTQVDGLGIDASFNTDVVMVHAPHGLYPAPLPSSDEPKATVLGWFTFLGKLVAQALLDERLLDLPLARPFVQALLGKSLVSDLDAALDHARAVDPAIGASLDYLHAHRDDPAIDEMGLSFVLLGNADVELCEGGAAKPVTRDTVAEFVRASLEMLLEISIRDQVAAFRAGFGSLVPLDALDCLSADDWLALLSDPTTELWPGGADELQAHMVCDHGYGSESRAIRWLVQVLTELTPDDQRLFVRFVTGSHRLPLGGLGKLSPTLTVVRKLSPDESSPSDEMLPSASTCTNYLKLPDYSSIDILRAKLLYCIREGQLSFHLS
ncbi:hypothetical protein SDRG_08879 [Saprolegnia diclina VS20]|uniref:HECT-type E3 ubiquitin transferase n=1 Tax=Saprolegnia diclina (strain VS20) TaxID=1156394 RepID=T0QI16_SAPDV|nr:hypothetical protein SDRG_08879 [Saprolegnia diclina VS20]EQC33360.1 hypothetical protein SDRG_08879 [Saprolegnia diclina VS20]|eukprot:XP_008613000.1 hypothetical protein SDRG_08879 [Saprolegnia diclina VS20]